MKVLLVNQHQSAAVTAGYYRRFLEPMPPITLAYLAAALERAGIDVAFYDDALAGGDDAAFNQALRTHSPDVVGLSLVTATARGAVRLSALTRSFSRDITVVMGNIHADTFHESILDQGITDVVVHGEGELTFVELVKALACDAPALDTIEGLSFVQDGAVYKTAPRPYIEDLDSLPFPAWHLFPMERYRLFNFARVREPGVLVLGSRGCPYGCTYCSLKIMGHQRRCRSASSIADEFEYLVDRFGFAQPSFTDPIFPLGKSEGLAFARELIRRGLHRRAVWITETRTDLVDQELLEALRESGLRRIMFGFEAGSAGQLRAIHKGTTTDSGFEAVRLAHAAGLQVIGFFMIGIPGATRATTRATIAYAKALGVDFAKFSVFVPFPGTAVYNELMRDGEIAEPEVWERYTSYPSRTNPPNYVPRDMTAKDIIRLQGLAYSSFYLRPSQAYRHLLRDRTLTPADAIRGVAALFGRFLSE